jgi:cyclohexanecarboxyl-CoA dehydrogenase
VTRGELVGQVGDGFVSVMQGFDYSRAIVGLCCDLPIHSGRTGPAYGGPSRWCDLFVR